MAAEAPPAVPAAVADRAAVVVEAEAAVPTAVVEAITANFHHDRNNDAGDANRIPVFFCGRWQNEKTKH